MTTSVERLTGRRAGPPSITSRLVLFYTVGALSILTTVAVLLYRGLSSEMRRQNEEDVVTLLTVFTSDAETSDQRFLLPAEDPEAELYQLRVFDENMQVLAASSRMREIPVPGPDASAAQIELVQIGDSYFLTAANWTRPDPGTPRRLVQVALDETDDEKLITYFGVTAIAAVLLSSLAFFSIGIVVARRGLQPLRDVTRAAEHIDASQLHERLVSHEWPSELRDLAEAFNRMLGRLDTTFSSLSRSASVMAHELRTPLTNLIGEAEIALSKERQPEEYRSVLESALEEYQRLRRILEALLFISRIENPTSKIPVESFSVRAEAVKVVDLFESLSMEGGLSVRLTGDAQIAGNVTLFGQAMGNVLHNALKNTETGGHIEIHVAESDGRVRVSVQDSGAGIPAEALPHVTSAFYKVDGARHTGQGVGLGLAIVKSIVAWHGGTLSIRSEVGRGTEVRMTFPALASGRPASADATSPESPMDRTSAHPLVTRALQLRGTDPHAPPLRVLDAAFDDSAAAIGPAPALGEFGPALWWPAPFAQLLRDAFAPGFTNSEMALTSPEDEGLEVFSDRWQRLVIEPFALRYRID